MTAKSHCYSLLCRSLALWVLSLSLTPVLSLAVFLSLSLFLSVCLSVSVAIFISLSLTLTLSIPLSASIPLLTLSLSRLQLCLYLSFYISVSFITEPWLTAELEVW